MATSGIYTYSRTLNQLAAEALQLLQAIGDGETITGYPIDLAKNSLNGLLKHAQTQGLHLWTEKNGTLFLAVGQPKYDLSTVKAANTYYETTTTAATTAAALSIAVTSANDIQADDVIGIIQNNNDLFWTTVLSVSGLTVRLSDPVTLATLSGAVVYNYRPSTATAPALLPVSRIKSVFRKVGDDYEIPMEFRGREDYYRLSNKTQTGTPIQAYYSRTDVAGESSGTMYLWSAPDSSVPVITFNYERKIQVMVNADDTLDFADYANDYIVYALAERLIPKFGCSPSRAMLITAKAEEFKQDVLAYGSSMYPIQFGIGR
jgi:hypothetical protein